MVNDCCTKSDPSTMVVVWPIQAGKTALMEARKTLRERTGLLPAYGKDDCRDSYTLDYNHGTTTGGK